MALYHLNPSTGDPGKCNAEKGNCPYGGPEDHYTSAEAARAAFEREQESFSKASGLPPELASWSGKLPDSVERAIARRWAKLSNESEGFRLNEHLDSMLQPPVFAHREKGRALVKASEVDYSGGEEVLLSVYSRQGGGNRECYCEDYSAHEPGCLVVNNEELENHHQFLYYEDDWDDRTYTHHYFSTGLTELEAEELEERERDSRLSRARTAVLKEVTTGALPPWAVLREDSSAQQAYEFAKSALERKRDRFTQVEAQGLLASRGLEALKDFDVELSESELTELGKLVNTGYYSNPGRFGEAYKRLRKSEKELKLAQQRMAEAEALPEGPLKEYLLGDRGEGSYTVQEKQGRRNVTVKKTFKRGTLLGEELKSAQRGPTNARTDLKESVKTLQEKKKALQELTKELADESKKLEKLRKDAWSAGWPARQSDIPPIEEKF